MPLLILFITWPKGCCVHYIRYMPYLNTALKYCMSNYTLEIGYVDLCSGTLLTYTLAEISS